MKSKLPFLACIAAGWLQGALEAYPIPPVTLWALAEEADLIILAEVARVEEKPAGDWSPSVATLQVRETWKGSPVKQCKVEFNENMACPAPPRYVPRKEVVAFLKKDRKDQDRWWTVGLSYGTLYPHRGDVPTLKVRLQAAAKLQRSPAVAPEAKQEWLVETAARRATRWHGLYELFPGSDRLHSYYDRERKKDAAPRLTPAQVERLAKGFTAEPDLGPSLPMMLTALRDHRSPAVDATAAALIDRLLEGKSLPYWTAQAMALVLERCRKPHPLAEKEPEEPLLRDPLLRGKDWDDDALREVWARARPELRVARIELPDIPRPGASGVGESTPP